jgi:hypothetical protein
MLDGSSLLRPSAAAVPTMMKLRIERLPAVWAPPGSCFTTVAGQELAPDSFCTIEIILFHHPHFRVALCDGDSSDHRVQTVVAGEIRNTGPIELGTEHAQTGDVTHVERVKTLHICDHERPRQTVLGSAQARHPGSRRGGLVISESTPSLEKSEILRALRLELRANGRKSSARVHRRAS